MLLHYTVEATDDAASPCWYVVATRDAPEEWGRTAAEYGREVLQMWIDSVRDAIGGQPSPGGRKPLVLVDEHGSPYLRAVVRLDGSVDATGEPAAVVSADQLTFTAR